MNRLSHLNRTASLGLLVFAMHSAPAMAQNAQNEGEEINEGNRNSGRQDIVVTAMRTNLPISALPVTVDIVDAEELASQVSMSGSRSEEHTSELQSRENLVCRLL